MNKIRMSNVHMNNMKRTQLAIQIDVLFAFHLMTDDIRQSRQSRRDLKTPRRSRPDEPKPQEPRNLNA